NLDGALTVAGAGVKLVEGAIASGVGFLEQVGPNVPVERNSFDTQTRGKSGCRRNPLRVWRAAMVWARVELSARRAPRCRMASPQWPTRCFTKALTGSIFN